MHPTHAAYSRLIARSDRFSYLPNGDRHYLQPPEPEYVFAVIGCGINGQGHIRSTFAEGRARIGGLFDTSEKSAQVAQRVCTELWPNHPCAIYGSLDEAVADAQIDGFIIATPNYTHRHIFESILQAGTPVYLEKPMATTVADAADIVKLTRKRDARVQVGLQYRYKATIREAIDAIRLRGVVGSPKLLCIREHRIPFLDKVGQWNKFAEYSGGTLVEKCCHYFDLFNLLAGSRPSRVFASGSHAVAYREFSYEGKSADILDNAAVVVEYENGVRATFDLCMFSPMFYEELVVCGDGGRLRTFEQEDAVSDQGPQVGLEVYRGEMHPSYTSRPGYSGMARSLGHSGADFFAHATFVDLVAGATDRAPTVEEGYWATVVGAAAEQSVRSGNPVEIGTLISDSDAAIE